MRNLIFLLIIAALVGIWYYPQLPERVATHFNHSATADGWMTRDGFMLVYAGLMLFLFGTFLGTGFLMRILPDSLINIPNREHWLASEQREKSKAFLETTTYQMGSLTLLFLIVTMAESLQANLSVEPALSGFFWFALIVYMILLGWLIIRMFQRFQRTPRGKP